MQSIANRVCGDFVTRSEADTEMLGRRVGETLASLGKAAALSLEGPLGAGKTCFIRGLVLGIGGGDVVASPTFALVHEYTAGRLPVAHLDFYRLRSAEEVLALGWDDLVADGIVVAEWGNLFPEVFPPGSQRVVVAEQSDGARKITIEEM